MVDYIRIVNSRFTSNTYVIFRPECDNVWVVDPGDTKLVFEWMKIHSKTTISGVILTHAHFDHIYGVNEIIEKYPQCTIYVANEIGRNLLQDSKGNGSKYTSEGPVVINEIARIAYLSDYLSLWDDKEMKIYLTLGHSEDSVCLLIDKLLFTGDILIKDVRTVTKIKGGSREKLKDSLILLEGLKGRELLVLPGHGDEFNLDEYDLENSYRMKTV